MMSRTSIFVILGACIIAGLLVTGCTQQQAPAPVQTTSVQTIVATTETTLSATEAPTAAITANMSNPASVNCGKIGGATEIRTAADGGQYGMCTFPNGTSGEDWALFRNEGCQTNVTPASTTPATGSTGMANPASVNCGKIGERPRSGLLPMAANTACAHSPTGPAARSGRSSETRDARQM